MTKDDIRKSVLARRNEMSESVRRQASQSICEAIANEPLFLDTEAIHVYMPIGTEVDITPVIELAWELGKDVGMMIVDGSGGHTQQLITSNTEYVGGPHGIREPVDADDFDMDACGLVIVPMVAGDGQCNRIGYGKGYYDQFLSQFPRPTIGAAFDLQIVPEIPVAEGDITLDAIITETGRYSME